MNSIVPVLAIAAVLTTAVLIGLAMLTICMRAEGRHISSDTAPHNRAETITRRLLGVYVRRSGETTPDNTRR